MEGKLAPQPDTIQHVSPPSDESLNDEGPVVDVRRNKRKCLIAMTFAVIFLALGDVSLSKGMKAVGSGSFADVWHVVLATVTSPYVIGGVVLLIGFLALYLTSLSWESLSFVLPLTAAAYVIVTIMAFFFLGEAVSPLRWAGSLLVTAGVAMVART
jgi:drug/metabolite transporter (DMT)-like permease